MSQPFIDSSALFTIPSALKGSARTIDLFGSLDNYNYKSTEAEADAEALKRDWTIVGLDIANAIGLYEQDNTSPTESAVQSA